VVSPVGSSLRKLNTVHNYNLPLSNDKSFLYSNAFMAKSGAQSLTFKSVTNRQTNKQIDEKTQRFCRPGGGRNPSPTKLGMIIEVLDHVLAPLKLLGSDA